MCLYRNFDIIFKLGKGRIRIYIRKEYWKFEYILLQRINCIFIV